MAHLESLDEEVKSLQDLIEEYISEEAGLQHRFNAIYVVPKKHNIDAQDRCTAFCHQQLRDRRYRLETISSRRAALQDSKQILQI